MIYGGGGLLLAIAQDSSLARKKKSSNAEFCVCVYVITIYVYPGFNQ